MIWHKKIEYFGHIVSAEGVAVDTSKIDAMLRWLVPTNLRELCGFLGFTGYYRKIVKGYSNIYGLLTEQLKKDSFKWTEEATRAFWLLQQTMT